MTVVLCRIFIKQPDNPNPASDSHAARLDLDQTTLILDQI